MRKTLRALTGRDGDQGGGSSALDHWYAAVADTPLDELGVGDLCRAIRQGLVLEELIPNAIREVSKDPVVGDMYDGEVASVLARVPIQFWEEHPSILRSALEVLAQAAQVVDEDVRAEISALERLAIDVKTRTAEDRE